MQTLKEILEQQHAARAAHDDPLTDRLMAEIVRLAEEVCVLRDRLDTSERLAAAGKPADAAAVDAFEADAETTARRLAGHRDFFDRLFSRLGE